MNRILLRSAPFIRAAKRLVKNSRKLLKICKLLWNFLSDDAFHPQLRTHKLKGVMTGSWACSVTYDLRIVFEFVEYKGKEAILLQTIGSYDEVY